MQSFNEMVSSQVSQLEDLGMLGHRRMNVAIDMHLIPRWDHKHGAELVRSKAKRGTHLFERYITVQWRDPEDPADPGGVSHACPD